MCQSGWDGQSHVHQHTNKATLNKHNTDHTTLAPTWRCTAEGQGDSRGDRERTSRTEERKMRRRRQYWPPLGGALQKAKEETILAPTWRCIAEETERGLAGQKNGR